MKKNNHITINLNDDDIKIIEFLSTHQRRSKTQLCYLILIDALQSELIKELQKNNDSELKQAHYYKSEF